MNDVKCNGETMRRIFAQLNENHSKLIPATTPFSIVEEDGGLTDYQLNNTTPLARLCTAISEVLPDESHELRLSYLNRMQALFRFASENSNELKSKDFLREDKEHTLYAKIMFDIVADAKLDKKGKLTRNSFFKSYRKAS